MRALNCLQLPLLLVPLLVAAAPPSSTTRRQLLLVSLDGFRHDYLTKYAEESKFLRQMASEGVFVKKMTTEFTTRTFPNHWTIVTGRHQESHGIVSNTMYDSVFNETFTRAVKEERWWNESLPIWITAKHQGLKAATFFWPGSEVEFSGTRPDHYFAYNESIAFEYRVDTVIKWLTEEHIDLCTLYFNEPDSAGHRYGPDSAQVATAVHKLDFVLESLTYRLKHKDVDDKVDIIITSDHGMTAFNSSKVINFNNTLDPFVERYMDSGPAFTVFAKSDMKEQLVEHLRKEKESKNLSIRVFTKETMPPHYHYSKHRRIPDVLVLPDPGYVVFRATSELGGGGHGYDNTYDEMKVPLIAFGPSFKRGAVVEGFRQVDIYGLMCHLLQITPQPNNGSLELLPKMLSSSANSVSVSVLAVAMALASGCFVRGA